MMAIKEKIKYEKIIIKNLLLVFFVVFSLICITGCFCDHRWSEATCVDAPICLECGELLEGGEAKGHIWKAAECLNPETCIECGETRGEALGHSWKAADCITAKTCTVCAKIEGEPLGHVWIKATCTEAKKCTVCCITEGEPLGHAWMEATCAKPMSCERCDITQGQKLEHDWKQATCTESASCSRCLIESGSPLGHQYVKNVCTNCSDKLIETHSELEEYLNENFNTLNTAIGNIEELQYEILVNSPNYWFTHDFKVHILTDLWCAELGSTLDDAIAFGDFLPHEDRVQAAVDILNFQMELVELTEAAFPGQKFELMFYRGGYEYPAIKVGYNYVEKFIWRNWSFNKSGSTGYGGTSISPWSISWYGSNTSNWTIQQIQKLEDDVRKNWTHYKLGY